MPKKKQEVTRSEFIKFRVTPFEKKIIESIAEETGLLTSNYVRRAALEKNIYARFTDDELSAYKTLIKFNNDIARIGNMFHERNPDLETEVRKTQKLIYEHIKKFKR